uniref:Uncharacterized protein n=1 Tax=Trichogramma kaykai TaxID=54128 RepID=A0ABD2W685_9HYME
MMSDSKRECTPVGKGTNVPESNLGSYRVKASVTSGSPSDSGEGKNRKVVGDGRGAKGGKGVRTCFRHWTSSPRRGRKNAQLRRTISCSRSTVSQRVYSKLALTTGPISPLGVLDQVRWSYRNLFDGR